MCIGDPQEITHGTKSRKTFQVIISICVFAIVVLNAALSRVHLQIVPTVDAFINDCGGDGSILYWCVGKPNSVGISIRAAGCVVEIGRGSQCRGADGSVGQHGMMAAALQLLFGDGAGVCCTMR